ncbi:translational GTPase TypA [Henriciella mobilis]|uniref:Large ribosomal subunit assembly factor BipA n=1 Tax=Henriciella mobilis TaxID=2305467 RepID=A0A399R5A5_9PROT|nr:translational GTPase TypA [Henriciella mobilis]RIJ14759.1 translational GTPase TypA [Henriciella mobilis]RIJ21715.1 translational GTPase TypA [Henriciella mobilis]RIJ26786.1 translational GTPase TypA [Henriciella mobilis]
MTEPTALRNIAIIAHVDHGKTTLVDCLLKQSGTFRENEQTEDRMMDSNDLERERGITILAKTTSVVWGDTRVNIVDTPGHADFGGEVERILNMVDGAIVLVDAAEGPMPQTKFVVSKALKVGLRPIVAVNKIDKPDSRPDYVINEVFDLFADLGADDEQLDFPILYGSAKNGWMSLDHEKPETDMAALFDLVIKHVPEPKTEDGPFRMLATTISADNFLGRILTGRITSGTVKPNQTVKVLSRDGELVEQGRVSKVLAFRGLGREPIDEGVAGDIVSISGLTKANVADTFVDPSVSEPIEAQPIDPPTLSMTFRVNDSPLAGTEGTKVTSRMIWDRLVKEAEGNVALKVERSAEAEAFTVSGRGELQLAVLIETMRREGFELGVMRPKVVMKEDPDSGEKLEPIEEVVIDVDDEHTGIIVQKLNERKADMMEMKPSGAGRTRLVFHAPTRGLIGYQGELLSDTRGTAIMNRVFLEYAPYKGPIKGRHTGVLVSMEQGEAVAFALWNLEDRGPMMIHPGDKVYQGMIIGEHNRDNDLEVNVLKGKKLSNVRASGTDEAVRLTPPLQMTLERSLAYIADDELVEVTPKSIRLRKIHLDPHERKKAAKAAANA